MSTENSQAEQIQVWRQAFSGWASIAVVGGLVVAIFYDSLKELFRVLGQSEEYGYGYLVPVITIFLIWQKKDKLELNPFHGSWLGFLIVVAGLLFYFLGQLATIVTITQYAFVMVVFGLALAMVGYRAFKEIAVPLLFLIFMIPLPIFLYQGLSAHLQLWSSALGVEVIRWFGISVYLAGNVIDLGTYKLQVVEACSGLRYLFPLATLAFMTAYFFKAAFWKKVVLFVSSLPITLVMNSFRIGMIGVLVEYWGIEMAEGFLHYFEGWVIFLACFALLIGEIWLLASIGKDRKPFREAFGIEFPEDTPAGATVQHNKLTASFIVASFAVLVATPLAFLLDERQEITPARKTFVEFPVAFDGWKGRRSPMEQIYLDVLKLTDYVNADFVDQDSKSVNLYIAYYDSQKTGESAHSPRSCLPGGGWEFKEMYEKRLRDVSIAGMPVKVNRVVTQLGDQKQIVYYWFQQRGRGITNEYLVKWYLFWDALTRNRSDGALVRLITSVYGTEEVEDAEERLDRFLRSVSTELPDYIPG